MVTLGRYQVTKRYKWPEEAEEAVNEKTYELLLGCMYAILADHEAAMEAEQAVKEIPQG